ncbi:MAG: pentapeptide repeat-containing protein [Pseudomonadota bacterium]
MPPGALTEPGSPARPVRIFGRRPNTAAQSAEHPREQPPKASEPRPSLVGTPWRRTIRQLQRLSVAETALEGAALLFFAGLVSLAMGLVPIVEPGAVSATPSRAIALIYGIGLPLITACAWWLRARVAKTAAALSQLTDQDLPSLLLEQALPHSPGLRIARRLIVEETGTPGVKAATAILNWLLRIRHHGTLWLPALVVLAIALAVAVRAGLVIEIGASTTALFLVLVLMLCPYPSGPRLRGERAARRYGAQLGWVGGIGAILCLAAVELSPHWFRLGAPRPEAEGTIAAVTPASPPLATQPSPISLTGAQMSGVDLSGAKLIGAEMADINLNAARLTKAWLDGATMRGASLDFALVDQARLDGADLANVKARQVQLEWSSLIGADLSGAMLNRADLTGADLTDAALDRADLSGARLVEADFSGASLAGADLRGADLSNAWNVETETLATALGNRRTKLPEGVERPYSWR